MLTLLGTCLAVPTPDKDYETLPEELLPADQPNYDDGLPQENDVPADQPGVDEAGLEESIDPDDEQSESQVDSDIEFAQADSQDIPDENPIDDSNLDGNDFDVDAELDDSEVVNSDVGSNEVDDDSASLPVSNFFGEPQVKIELLCFAFYDHVAFFVFDRIFICG